MDHNYIEELDLIDRYLMGKLTADESAGFEEHFVDCAQCVDRLKTTKDLIHGFRLMASRQPVEELDYGPRELHWYSLRSVTTKGFALVGGFLLLVVIAGAVLIFNRIRMSPIETDEAKRDSARWEQRFEEQRQSTASADSKHKETERELTERLTHLQAELENMREPEIARLHDGSLRPQINVPIFVLKATRGSEQQSDSINRLTLPRSPTSFLILLALEGELDYRDYRMTILDDHNQLIWKSGGLKRDPNNSLSLGLNSRFFRGGDYLLTVEGVSEAGATKIVAKYRVRL
jgi:hypothetical protein